MNTLKKYLIEAKNKLITNKNPLHIILGNESGDLDSMISAITLAYLYSEAKYKTTNVTALPIWNIHSNQFNIHTENVYLLNKLGLIKDDIIFKDTFSLNELKEGDKITLVDHHVLSKDMKFIEPFIQEIYDHRPLNALASWKSNVLINIKQVGSCATLISEQFFKLGQIYLIDPVATSLYETIIFDTIGFKIEAARFKDLDVEMCDKLEQILKITNKRTEVFERLWNAHGDVSQLTGVELLAKDMKLLESNIIISGLSMLVNEFLNKSDAVAAIKDFTISKKLTILILMGVETQNGFKRDLALYCDNPNNTLFINIKSRLIGDTNLDLLEIDLKIRDLIYFQQNNNKMSRKQILPIVQECIFK